MTDSDIARAIETLSEFGHIVTRDSIDNEVLKNPGKYPTLSILNKRQRFFRISTYCNKLYPLFRKNHNPSWIIGGRG